MSASAAAKLLPHRQATALSRCIQIQPSARQFICQLSPPFWPTSISIHGQKEENRMYLPMRRLRSWRCMFYASFCIFNEVFIFTTHSQRMRMRIGMGMGMGMGMGIQILGWPRTDTDADTFPSQHAVSVSVRFAQLQLAEGVETKLPPIFVSKCFWPTWCRCQFRMVEWPNGGGRESGL